MYVSYVVYEIVLHWFCSFEAKLILFIILGEVKMKEKKIGQVISKSTAHTWIIAQQLLACHKKAFGQ